MGKDKVTARVIRKVQDDVYEVETVVNGKPNTTVYSYSGTKQWIGSYSGIDRLMKAIAEEVVKAIDQFEAKQKEAKDVKTDSEK